MIVVSRQGPPWQPADDRNGLQSDVLMGLANERMKCANEIHRLEKGKSSLKEPRRLIECKKELILSVDFKWNERSPELFKMTSSSLWSRETRLFSRIKRCAC